MKKQEIRIGFEWYRKLSKNQKKQFKANCGSSFQYRMNKKSDSEMFLSTAFLWGSTKQGFLYWFILANKQL